MISLLDRESRLLLRAATQADAIAVPAFRQWRAETPLDDAASQAHRVMPMLVDLVARNGIADPDILRLRGIRRQVWARNAVQLKDLMVALDALEADGIRPMLLKGGALFARSPALAGSRPVSDYDILMPPGKLEAAVASLERAGFVPEAMSWRAIVQERIVIDTSGTAIRHGDHTPRVDFHWRPLKFLHDPHLTDTLWTAAETRTWQSREVIVPSMAHHLFLAIARCDEHDIQENFQRLLEGQMLLTHAGTPESVDWSSVDALLRQYGYEARGAAYFRHIEQDCGVRLPAKLIGRNWRRAGFSGRLESRLRAIPPKRRTPVQTWVLNRRDRRFRRSNVEHSTPGLLEALLLSLPPTSASRLRLIRRSMVRRYAGRAASTPRFVEGWFYEEAEGRWSNGGFAGLVVPLDAAQRAGAPVHMRGYLMTGTHGVGRMSLNAGAQDVAIEVTAPRVEFALDMVCTPEPALGGDGFIVMSMPDAISPMEKGGSIDTRPLGVFLREVR